MVFKTGAHARTKSNTHQEGRADGSIVEITKRTKDKVLTRTKRVVVDRSHFRQAPPELKAYLRKYADAAESADADAVKAHRKEQRRAHRLLREASAAESSRSRVVLEDADLVCVEAKLAEDSGWTKLTGQKRIPIQDPGAMYAGSEDSPLHKPVMQAFMQDGGTGARLGHDKHLKAYTAAVGAAGQRAAVLARTPELAELLKKDKRFRRVLNYLVANLAWDHIWSSATCHPKNIYLEFKAINGYFKDYKNQAAKLARYGSFCRSTSMTWMSTSIELEKRATSIE